MKMNKAQEIINIINESLAINEDFGKGWFYNLKNKKLFVIPAGDLGPHGDHDGWISIGDNAKAIGVDGKKAIAFQNAAFGIDTNAYPQFKEFEEDGDDGYVEPNRVVDNEDKFKKLFKKVFGTDLEVAWGLGFPELVRIRLWPKSSFLSFVFGYSFKIDNKALKISQDIYYKLKKIPKVASVLITGANELRGSFHDFLTAKSVRDFV